MGALQGKTIAVVGGGPGGLTLARLLQMQGADVTVYERDTSRSARLVGSALDLHVESGLAALEAAGLMDGSWARHRPELNRLRVMDQDAKVLYDHSRSMDARPEIERAPLRDLLLDSLLPGTVVWDRKLERAELEGEQVRLVFAGGESVLADLAVGADGANSRLRALVTRVRPAYAGVSLVEGYVPRAATVVPEVCAVLGGSAVMALGGEKTLGLGMKADGGVLFYAGLRNPDEEAREALKAAMTAEARLAWFARYFAGWSDFWTPLFAWAEGLVLRPLLVCPSDQHWEAQANVTLIGDAAHVMPPYAGEGVNMAMLDALVLSRELQSKPDTRTAVAAYEAEMFARMRDVTDETMTNTEMFYAPDAGEQISALFKGFAEQQALGTGRE